jgi:uncharacterized protein (DUF58 family)
MAHLPRVRARVALHSRKPVRGLLDGEHLASQVGRGMDFNDLRDYVRGDDTKDIDWKASARTGGLLVKRYEAVRQHTLLLVLVSGRSMAAHLTPEAVKRDVAVVAAGYVGLGAVGHGDRVMLVHGSSSGHQVVEPGSGEAHLERCLATYHDATSLESAPADLEALLRHVARVVRRRTIMLVVCDEEELGEGATTVLRRLSVQHEVLLLALSDLDPTTPGNAPVHDVDSGARLPDWVRADRALAREYAEVCERARRSMAGTLDALGIVHERAQDEQGAVVAVHRLLERQRRAPR